MAVVLEPWFRHDFRGEKLFERPRVQCTRSVLAKRSVEVCAQVSKRYRWTENTNTSYPSNILNGHVTQIRANWTQTRVRSTDPRCVTLKLVKLTWKTVLYIIGLGTLEMHVLFQSFVRA